MGGPLDVEARSLHEFIQRSFEHPRIKAVIQQWRVDPKDAFRIVERELLEMGIYAVPPLAYSQAMIEQIVFCLKNSPNVRSYLAEAERQERIRNSRRR